MISVVIARRLWRRLRATGPVAPVFVVTVFLFATNVFLSEQSLTRQQVTTNLLGDYDAAIWRFSLETPPGDDAFARTQDRLDDAGLKVDLGLQVPDFPLPSLADDGIYFREMSWTPNPFPGARALEAGKFPTRPGEVAWFGPDKPATLHIGDRISVMGDRNALTVVGFVENTLERQNEILAAPGTWATLSAVEQPSLSELAASPAFYFYGGVPSDTEVASLVRIVSEEPVWAEAMRDPGSQAEFQAAVMDRARVANSADQSWIQRSPLSFWAPGISLLPMSVVLSYLVMMRRLGPAVRAMSRNGVPANTAAGGGWLSLIPWIVIAAAAGAALGSTAGHIIAQTSASGWGNPGATWRFPKEAVLILTVGGTLGVAAGWWVLRSAIPRKVPQPHSAPQPRNSTQLLTLRRWSATALGCVAIVFALNLRTSEQGLLLAALVAALAGLATPDVLRIMVGARSERLLVDRLAQRLMWSYWARTAATASAVAVAVAVTTGMLTLLVSDIEATRRATPVSAPAGLLALDNDNAPAFPVDPIVVRAAETVPALRNQTPVQIRVIGQLREATSTTPAEITGSVGSQDLPGIAYAFDSTSELERTLGRRLSSTDRDLLSSGGVLVTDDRVRIERDQIQGQNNSTGQDIGIFPAARLRFTRAPWFEAVPFVMLSDTAQQHGLPLSTGALIYTGVNDSQAAAVREALALNGINPEIANIHSPEQSVVPQAALLGSALGLFALVLLLAMSVTRAQVVSMRAWASRLTQLGVRLRWARRVLSRQYLQIMLVAVPTGMLAGLVPLLVLRMRVNKILIVFPWLEITVLLSALLGAVLLASYAASRRLSSTEARGWSDAGE